MFGWLKKLFSPDFEEVDLSAVIGMAHFVCTTDEQKLEYVNTQLAALGIKADVRVEGMAIWVDNIVYPDVKR